MRERIDRINIFKTHPSEDTWQAHVYGADKLMAFCPVGPREICFNWLKDRGYE